MHLDYLKRAVDLAEIGLLNGNSPFGSVLVLDNKIVFEDHSRTKDGDQTNHPEFTIAKYAIANLSLEERKRAIVYTSGEHCPMCSAAHGWANLVQFITLFHQFS